MLNDEMKNIGVFLLVLVVAGSFFTLRLLPDGKIAVRPYECSYYGCKRMAIPIVDIWSFYWYGNPHIASFLRRLVGTTVSRVQRNLIRVHMPRMSLSKEEYIRIRELMEKWNVDIGELCRYSLMSIVKAHNDGQ